MKVDGHLLIDLKNGDEKAFETLFWKYNEHVYHFIYSLLYEIYGRGLDPKRFS